MNWKNKRVAILGWAVDTQDVEPWLRGRGAQVSILDEKDNTEAFAKLDEYEILVRTPGVYRYRKELLEAEKKGVAITSKMKIFFDECPTKNIIGVTGTKGKGTTSTLVYEMLKAGGKDVYLGGNMGKGVFSFIGQLTTESWVVLELSSFQLVDLHVSPHIGVVLMVTTDHLDWHKSVNEYIAAKSQIARFQTEQDYLIFNGDYDNSRNIANSSKGQKVEVHRTDWTSPVRLRGDHNRENLAAAAAVARIVGVSEELILSVGQSFKGLEHRLEEVGVVNGVTYYDDSISTTPETAIAAIQAFTEPMILILGGSDKGSNFDVLGETVASSPHVKGVVLLGLMAEKIKQSLLRANASMLILERAQTMTEAVIQATSIAKSGDVVVLSPACASFDMFKNYKDRGEQFKNAVSQLTR